MLWNPASLMMMIKLLSSRILTIPVKLQVAQISCYLSSQDANKKAIFQGGTIKPNGFVFYDKEQEQECLVKGYNNGAYIIVQKDYPRITILYTEKQVHKAVGNEQPLS